MVNLDPQDWEALDGAFRRALTAGFSHYKGLEEQPVWRPAPESVREAFRTPMPQEPEALETLVGRFENELLPYGNGNTHPSFYGWVHGGGNLYGALGELCAAMLNSNLGGRDHIAHQVEQQVLDWCRELFAFPATSSGLLTSGTSMSTLIALAVARHKAVGASVKTAGVQARTSPLVGYCSEQSHNSVVKAFQMLGLGSDALKAIPVHEDHTLDCNALMEQVAADRAAGLTPFCVIATLGTVNTGAIDDFTDVAQVCQREDLWLHVDAAFGGAVALLEEYSQQLRGLERADSLAFDFHKWFQVPYVAGGLLVRDAELHRATFSERREYLATQSLGLDAGAPWPCDFGPELSRGFLALKVWFTFQGVGASRIADVVRKHCAIARATAERVDRLEDLERLAPVPMNILCLRYRPALEGVPGFGNRDDLNSLNRAIVTQLQLQGRAAASTTTLDGVLAIRVAIVNHRTEQWHLDDLIDGIRTLGARIDAGYRSLLQPADWHLMRGGDARLMVDPETGLNRYGCSPAPRDHAYTFASSTATSISTPAYRAAEEYRERLLHDLIRADAFAPLAEHSRAIEDRIACCFGLTELAPDIHLTPSGTDAQLQAVAAITTADPGKWVSIVCGADETGSGTALSVSGCHFENTTCLGVPVAKGERLEGMPGVGYQGIDFRENGGELKTPDQLDREIEQAVRERIEAGHSVILHTLDQSKLGCWAPSNDALARLRARFGHKLQVVVDACQMRLDPMDLQAYLGEGDILLITGSKFFTGPPFSGAVIYPSRFTDRLLDQGRSLPSGLRDYLPWAELGRWEPILENARQTLSISTLLKWWAALMEIERYYRVPRTSRLAGLDRFSNEVNGMLDQHPGVEPLFNAGSAWWARWGMHGDELSSRRSIFPFLLRGKDGSYLSHESVQAVYRLLNQDLSDVEGLSKPERAIAAQCCHIGQPVRIGSVDTSALRISMGARIISDGCDQGQETGEHLDEELRQVRLILDKLALCLDRFPGL